MRWPRRKERTSSEGRSDPGGRSDQDGLQTGNNCDLISRNGGGMFLDETLAA